jgi:uncharacterized protein (TIGR02594 family)
MPTEMKPRSLGRGDVTAIPATVKYRNPGACYPGPSSKPFGGLTHAIIGGGHKIAVFPTMTDGASSMMHLLWRVYTGMTFSDAIAKWSGGNNINSYLRVIESRTRWTRHDYITKQLLETQEMAIELCKAMAWHEAGREYPMTDAQWREAHEQFMTVIGGGSVPIDRVKPLPVTAALELAKSHLGEREIAGSQHNPFIVDCFKEIGATPRNDETAWCAAFAGAMLKRSGMACLEGDAGLTARGYLNYGHAIDEPEEGCLVVFWRVKPNSWQGHVAFVESWTATTLTIVGGNQSNAVTRMTVARTGPKSQVLGYRRPAPVVTPARDVLKDDVVKRDTVGLLGTLITLYYMVKDWIGSAISGLGDVIGILPDAAETAGSAVSTGQSLFGAAGIPWPLPLGLAVVAVSIIINLRNRWKHKRVNKGALTRPPYETDEVPDGDAEDAFETIPEDLPPKRPRKAREPAAKKAPARKRKPAKRRACA